MRKLSRYLLLDFLTLFKTAILLITFSFSIGAIYKAVDVMAKGLPMMVVSRFFLYNLPYSLAYTIPISALFSSLLLFGRLSADNEINAMRSGGISLWRTASPVLLFSVFLVCFCLYNNGVVYPRTTYANRKLIRTMGVEDPIKLLEEGRFIREFDGYMIYVGGKNRNKVKDLIVYEIDEESGEISGTVRAERGIMTVDKEKSLLKVDLFDVRMEIPDPDASENAARTRYVNAKQYPIRLDFRDLTGQKTVDKKRKNMTLFELIGRIRDTEAYPERMSKRDVEIEHSRDLVEFNQRICLSLSPLIFVFVTIPLGIKAHHRESSAGMLMSLGIMFVYYAFIILSDAFDKSPHLRPWLLPWIPIVSGQILGFFLFRRVN